MPPSLLTAATTSLAAGSHDDDNSLIRQAYSRGCVWTLGVLRPGGRNEIGGDHRGSFPSHVAGAAGCRGRVRDRRAGGRAESRRSGAPACPWTSWSPRPLPKATLNVIALAARLVQLRGRPSTASRPSTAWRSTRSTRSRARVTRSRPSSPTRTTAGPRPRTSSTSVSHSARDMVAQGLLAPYKVSTWDEHPRCGQGCRRLLVWRLLRRAGVRDQHPGRAQPAQGLGGPPEARVQGPGRPVG